MRRENDYIFRSFPSINRWSVARHGDSRPEPGSRCRCRTKEALIDPALVPLCKLYGVPLCPAPVFACRAAAAAECGVPHATSICVSHHSTNVDRRAQLVMFANPRDLRWARQVCRKWKSITGCSLFLSVTHWSSSGHQDFPCCCRSEVNRALAAHRSLDKHLGAQISVATVVATISDATQQGPLIDWPATQERERGAWNRKPDYRSWSWSGLPVKVTTTFDDH